MVGEVVFGWDSSRRSPRASPRSASTGAIALSDGAAGAKSGKLENRPQSRRRCFLGLSTTVDELIHGRDEGSARLAPTAHLAVQFDDHAGLRASERVFGEGRENRKKPGISLSKMAVIDTIIYGRDVDGSGEDPHEAMMKKFRDHAGMRCKEEHIRHMKPGLRLQSTVDNLLYGRDIDGSGEGNAHEDVMAERNAGAAGVRSGDKARGRKNVLQMQTGVDEVVFNKVHPPSELEDFSATYRDYAGIRSGQSIIRTASCPAGQLTARSSRAPLEGQQDAASVVLSEQELARHDLSTHPQEAQSEQQEQQQQQPQPQQPQPQQSQQQQPPQQQLPLPPPQQPPREAWASDSKARPPEPLAAPPPASPTPSQLGFAQRVNPFGGRRPSSASSCSSASRIRTSRGVDRRICFDEGASTSSRGSIRPRWR